MAAILPADRNDRVTTRIRPLAGPDVVAAVEIQLASFDDLDRRLGEPPTRVTDIRRDWAQARVRHFLTHDAGGCWVSTNDAGEITGVALASVRGDLWGLSLLVVTPRLQSAGSGRALLDAALGYADGCDRAVILSSRDARAIRLYAMSGFDVHPQLQATGVPDLREQPADSERVRTGGAADAPLLEAVDQQVRRATRGPDHDLMARRCELFVCDDDAGRGYAQCTTTGQIAALAASDDATASLLMWRCLDVAAAAKQSTTVGHITAGQQWAVRTALAARLSLGPTGPVLWRGGSPPSPYLPSGALL
jgi:GNAT superfamily N-acetyltransferase